MKLPNYFYLYNINKLILNNSLSLFQLRPEHSGRVRTARQGVGIKLYFGAGP